ncbi:mitochondrial carrier [Testicularia cyperi]|uniref:Mitochondrial carrier n=1 Tax=Testicularia cyperi TaxID=1882483 RepID=A0A317XLQ1_9BASI|nr:mitochondrial carrier [Testicularia cyperi]
MSSQSYPNNSAGSSAASQAHPLRPYYQPPEDSVFIATAPRFSTSGAPQAAAASTTRGAPPSSGIPSTRPAANRYMSAGDAKPYVATTSSSALGDADAGLHDVIRALLISGALQYTSTCLAMPFEVGKLLLQVQWVPRDDIWLQVTQQAAQSAARPQTRKRTAASRREAGIAEDGKTDQLDREGDGWTQDVSPEAAEWDDEINAQEEDDEADEEEEDAYGAAADLSDEDDADAYFRDAASRPSRPDASLYSDRPRRRRMVDSSGYVMRRSVHDDGARPEFVMPVVVRGGVWEMMKAVGRGKEGWLGLWKGSLTSFVLETTSATIQPIVSSILSLFAPTAMSPLPLAYAPYPYKTLGLLLSSHLITGIIVSPLDLVRTRLIAQSTLAAHRKYSGPYDAIKKMLREEGGWKTAYLHPNLLIPAILDFTLRPLLSLGAPLLIEHTLRLEPNTHPISYAIAELAVSTASLCVTLPIETVRRRLQLQMRTATSSRSAKTTADKQQLTSASLKSAATGSSAGGVSLSTGSVANVGVRGLRTCVETRPVAYVGVVEAIYRIVTEESSITPRRSSSASKSASAPTADKPNEAADHMMQSGILAKAGHSSFGGLRSLYRGFGMAFGANLVVFMLTLVSGERAGPAGWAEI